MEKRARNFYVIAAAIIVYLFAGADLDQLTVLGIRAPAQFPVVFSWASVFALVWFWWRYHLPWLAQQARVAFRDAYLQELHQRKSFVRHVKKSVNHEQILESYNQRKGTPTDTVKGFERYTETSGRHRHRFLISIQDLTYRSGETSYEVGIQDFPEQRYIKLKIPWWFHWVHSPGFFLWKAIREDSFASLRLPQIVFATAIVLITCKAFGYDPAGLFGLLTDPSAPSNSCQSDFTGWLSVFGAFTTKTSS